MARSLKKGSWVPEKLLKKVQKAKSSSKSGSLKTWYRAATIIPDMIGLTFEVHNGKNFIKVFVTENMVGHRLGEFSPTKKFIRHGGRMQREQEAAQKVAEKAKSETAAEPAKK